jgi:hypothetical protein
VTLPHVVGQAIPKNREGAFAICCELLFFVVIISSVIDDLFVKVNQHYKDRKWQIQLPFFTITNIVIYIIFSNK